MNPYLHPYKLDDYEIKKLSSFTEEDCVKAIRILKARLKLLRNEDYTVLQLVTDLNLSTRARNVLLNCKLYTVKDILTFGVENIALLKNAGTGTVKEIKEAIEKATQGRSTGVEPSA